VENGGRAMSFFDRVIASSALLFQFLVEMCK
jgi:hypothetical protein